MLRWKRCVLVVGGEEVLMSVVFKVLGSLQNCGAPLIEIGSVICQ